MYSFTSHLMDHDVVALVKTPGNELTYLPVVGPQVAVGCLGRLGHKSCPFSLGPFVFIGQVSVSNNLLPHV